MLSTRCYSWDKRLLHIFNPQDGFFSPFPTSLVFLISLRLWGMRSVEEAQIEFTRLKLGETLIAILTDTEEEASMMGVGQSRLETVGKPFGMSEAELNSLERLVSTARPTVDHDSVMPHINSNRAKPATGS